MTKTEKIFQKIKRHKNKCLKKSKTSRNRCKPWLRRMIMKTLQRKTVSMKTLEMEIVLSAHSFFCSYWDSLQQLAISLYKSLYS